MTAKSQYCPAGAGLKQDISALRKISPDELEGIATAHMEWLESKGKSGKKADLSNADLRGADLEAFILTGSDMTGAVLYDANLRNAELGDVKGLLAGSLAGADVTNTKLPDGIRGFETLEYVAEASKLARPILFLIMSISVYVLATVVSTTDTALIIDAPTSLIPNVDVPIPTAVSYRMAPVLILFLYIYLLLYLKNIWQAVSTLPSVFPDGTSLDRKIYPWLLNDVVRSNLPTTPRIGAQRYSINSLVSVFFAYWTAPMTLVLLWLRYLPRHDWLWTLLQIGSLTIAIAFGIAFYRTCIATLRGKYRDAQTSSDFYASSDWRFIVRLVRRHSSVCWTTAVAALSLLISFGAIERTAGGADCEAGTWVASTLQGEFGMCAKLTGAVLSIRPEDWWKADKVAKIALEGVIGANLNESDLRHASLRGAFLAKADLKSARLDFADLRETDLREADLRGASLRQATLIRAKLKRAKLNGKNTDLRGANLREASLPLAELQDVNLEGANLRNAGLPEAYLRHARLRRVNMSGANLEGTKLMGADFREAVFVETRLREANLTGAKLQEATLERADLTKAILGGAKLQKAHLEGAKLHGVLLQGAKLNGAVLQSALLVGANLQYADLSDTDFSLAILRGASLNYANLQGSILAGTDLSGADLRNVKGLSQEQLHKACGDNQTSLPQGLVVTPCENRN